MSRCRLLIVVGLAAAVLSGGLPGALAAQEATPAVVCNVAPRSPGEVPSLTGTPAPAGALPEGEPVDAETVAALEETLRLARACAAAGDLPRLLALYTDAYIAAEVLPAEATPIVPGRPPAEAGTRPAGTPVPMAEPAVAEARLLPDGRVAARVVTGARVELVVFRYDEDRQLWQIDAVAPAADATASPPAEQPAAVEPALVDAAARLGVDPSEVSVVQVEAREWPDASLGCPQPGKFYAQVVTPGYVVVVAGNGRELEYHADERGNIVLCEEGAG